eukprot:m.3255 g.3255  ORF g.3255 m.3255 type:complete len:175 (-) comp2720_c0_seq1:26-550(-)
MDAKTKSSNKSGKGETLTIEKGIRGFNYESPNTDNKMRIKDRKGECMNIDKVSVVSSMNNRDILTIWGINKMTRKIWAKGETITIKNGTPGGIIINSRGTITEYPRYSNYMAKKMTTNGEPKVQRHHQLGQRHHQIRKKVESRRDSSYYDSSYYAARNAAVNTLTLTHSYGGCF